MSYLGLKLHVCYTKVCHCTANVSSILVCGFGGKLLIMIAAKVTKLDASADYLLAKTVSRKLFQEMIQFHQRVCDLNQVKSPMHLLFECPYSNDMRSNLWKIVLDSCPPALQMEMLQMDSMQKTVFIFSGLANSSYIQELHDWYRMILNYCYALYSA